MGRANTFPELIKMLQKAESKLVQNAKLTDPVDRTISLRGIYYGTDWSLDYKVERKRSEPGARIRNLGFITYTGGHMPADPRPALGDDLFNDLQASQSMHVSKFGIDVGHVLIGLETRASVKSRSVPFPGQGGTGIEIVTWLGDLGGGAASLARKRITNPATSVSVIFNNQSSDYGVMDNLEGDAGGYLVACGQTPGGATTYGQGGIADAFASYLPISNGNTEWPTRASRFATALGATVSGGVITNGPALITKLTDQLYDFAVWYAATRWVPSGELMGKQAELLCTHVKGAAKEVAMVFVSTLIKAMANPTQAIKASDPYPPPTTAGKCESKLLQSGAKDPSSIRKQLQEWGKDLGKLFD